MFNKIFSNKYLLSSIKKVITILCSVATTSLISRYLGPELKGEYSVFISMLNIAVIFAEFGLFKLYSKAKRDKMENSSNLFFSLCILKFVFLLVSAVFVTLIMIGVNSSKYLWLLPVMVCVNALQGELVFMLLLDKFKKTVIISSLAPILNTMLLLFAYLFLKRNLYFVLAAFMIKDIFSVASCIIFGKYKLIVSKNVWEIIKNNTSIIVYPVIAALLLDFNYKIDVFFLKGMTSTYIVGIYASAVSLSEIAWMVPDIFKEVLFNKTAKSDSVDSINFSLRVTNVIVLLFSIGVILFGKLIIKILFGDEDIDSYSVALVLLLGVHSMAVFKILNPLYQSTGQWKLYTTTLFIGVIANVILNASTIPLIGAYGAAASSVVSYAVCGGVLLYSYTKQYKVKVRQVFMINQNDLKYFRSFFMKRGVHNG